MTSAEYKVYQERMNQISSMGLVWDKAKGCYLHPNIDASLTLYEVLETGAAWWNSMTDVINTCIADYNRQQAELKASPAAIWNEIKKNSREEVTFSGLREEMIPTAEIKAIFESLGVELKEPSPF